MLFCYYCMQPEIMNRKIAGIITGIVVGAIPLFGIIASCTYAWIKRKYIPAVLLSASLVAIVVTLGVAVKNQFPDSRYLGPFTTKLSKEVTAYISTGNNIDAISLDSAVQSAVFYTSQSFGRSSVALFFRNAAEKTFTPEEQEKYSAYISALYQLSVKPGKDLRDKVEDLSRKFVYGYWQEESAGQSIMFGLVGILSWILGFIFSIVLFKDLYIKRNGVAVDKTQPAPVQNNDSHDIPIRTLSAD